MPRDAEAQAALDRLARQVSACRQCPRLVAWREQAAAEPPRRYDGEDYWARPLPGFGDPEARLVVVGLAPAAHGANRTGRMFTGDRSGEWLYGAAASGRVRQPADIRASRRRPATERRLRHRGRPLRSAGQPPDSGRARRVHSLPGHRAAAVGPRAGAARARLVRMGRCAEGGPRARNRRAAAHGRASATAPRPSSAPMC